MKKILWPAIAWFATSGTIFCCYCLIRVDKIAQSYQRDNVKLIRSKVELTKEVVQLRDSLNHCGFYVTEIDPDSLHIQKQ
jgi:hypothetical protein